MPAPRTSPDAFIFDLDGVIIDSEPLHEQATEVACARHAIDVPEQLFEAFRGRPDREVVAHLTQGTTIDPEALLAAKHTAYRALLAELTLMPGVLDFLRMLADGAFPLALVTSAARHDQERTFARFDLAPYFSAVVTADDVTHAKPHPEPYERAVQKLGVEPSACWVVEDSTHGVASARAAGCRVVGLCSSFSAAALRTAGAQLTVEGYGELEQRLEIAPA